MDGFLIINKDKGITSFGVCNRIKKLTNTKHVGHTGTLDPNTTGVLVVSLGKACKTLELLKEHTKEYKTTILFGKTSDTLDVCGNVIDFGPTNLNIKDVIDSISLVAKKDKQVPPMFSAIKKNGVKMYELARKGEVVELPERDVHINNYKILSDIYTLDGYQAIDVYLNTSKGFYVRSFVRDVADTLNTKALMYNLDRISSGQFNIKDSIKLDDDNIESKIISIEEVFKNLDKLEVNDFMAKLVLNGVVLDERQIKTDKEFLVYNNNRLIAIYKPYEEYKYKAVVILG